MTNSLSIIIVNYKSGQLLFNCIRSVIKHTLDVNFEILVVDNSPDHSIAREHFTDFPSVRWIDMNYNAGFARANNEAIRQSNSPIVLLLNADTIILDNAIGKTYNHFVQSDYSACGVQLLNPDGSAQISGNYVKKGGLNYLLPLPFIGSLMKLLGQAFNVSKPNLPDSNSETAVDWINGAFLMVKRAAIEQAGLMDEDFFLYAEEAEWCSRLRKTGPLCIYGQFKIIHLQGEVSNETFKSSGKGYYNLSDKKGLQIMVSNLVRIRKEFGVFWFFIILFFYVLEIPFSLFLIIFAAVTFRQWKGFTKNVLHLLTLTPTIIRNKPHFYKVL